MPQKLCKECYYRKPGPEDEDQCMRYPPLVAPTKRPVVLPDDFCGEWRDEKPR